MLLIQANTLISFKNVQPPSQNISNYTLKIVTEKSTSDAYSLNLDQLKSSDYQ